MFMDDVDVLHEEYKESGAIIHLAPTNMPWGTREMNVEDPGGHRFRMSSDSKGPADKDALARLMEAEQSGT